MLARQLWSAVSSPSMCFTFDMHDHCRSFNAASNNTRSWLLSNVIQQEFLFFSYDSHLSYLSCDCYLSFEKLGMSKLRFVERIEFKDLDLYSYIRTSFRRNQIFANASSEDELLISSRIGNGQRKCRILARQYRETCK